MKTRSVFFTTFFSTLFFCSVFSPSAYAAKKIVEREVTFQTESIDGKTHWSPESISVAPGEKLKLVFKHELKGGPEFHGITITPFHIVDKVDRNKTKKISVTVPADITETTIEVSCQFHPAHVPAVIKVRSGN
jgi:hypothetical protein